MILVAVATLILIIYLLMYANVVVDLAWHHALFVPVCMYSLVPACMYSSTCLHLYRRYYDMVPVRLIKLPLI